MPSNTPHPDGLFEWRWVDDKGRPMTNWKNGDPPPVLDLEDGKGGMHVEVRVALDLKDEGMSDKPNYARALAEAQKGGGDA